MTASLLAPGPADLPTRAADLRPRLDTSAVVLTRPSGHVQVGWGPERALLVAPPPDGTTRHLAQLLRALDGVHDPASLVPVAAAAGLGPDGLHDLLAELCDAGLLTWTVPPGEAPRRTAALHGRGPLADRLAEGLQAAGIDVRRSHGRAVPTTRPVDVVVLSDDLVVDPSLVSRLVSARTPHLSVRLRDGCGVIGPLVLPGRSSCLRCADLHRSDLDPEWPLLAAQLLGRTGEGTAAAVRATAALALGQVEHLLRDGAGGERAPGSLGATLELDLCSDVLRRRPWPAHPRCGCGAHP